MKIKISTLILSIMSIWSVNCATGQSKNSISIESGYFFGGPAAKISNQMETDGFGDDESAGFLFYGSLFSGSGTTSYPKKEKRGLRYWLRYERELKNNRSIELSFGNVNNSRVFGQYNKFVWSKKYFRCFCTKHWIPISTCTQRIYRKSSVFSIYRARRNITSWGI